MTYSIIQKSQLEGALRLDAEYYQPEFIEIKNNLLARRHWVLGSHAFVTDGEHGSVNFIPDGIKYLTAENIGEGFLNLKDIRFVSQEVDNRNHRASLQKNDVVLSIKGTVGIAAITRNEDLPANMNRDVSRIHIKNTINPYYLVVFLNSKYGKRQTTREGSGNVQQMITLQRIRALLIPEVSTEFQDEIERLCLEAQEQALLTKRLYTQAENLLLEELGLKNFNKKNDLFSIVSLSEVQSANRDDAEYFQNKFKLLFNEISDKTNLTPLGKIAKVQRGLLIDPRYYSELGKQYIRGADFTNGRISLSKATFINNNFVYKNETIVNEGDIVYASIGSVGNLAIVDREFNGSYISNNLAKIEANQKYIIPEYLLIVLRSIIGSYLFEKEASQTAQPKISDFQVKNFQIPVLANPIQQKIADLVRQSHTARQESKQHLEEAKRKVEKMIEER